MILPLLSLAVLQSPGPPRQIGAFTGGPNAVPLWAGGAPGARGRAPEDVPSITPFLPPPDRATGAAIVVCPGGGYQFLADHEGTEVARWLNSVGVAAFVLKYRLAPRYRHPAQLRDVSRAIRIVRARANEWRLDPGRIGVMGFSAGGHLASMAATHFDEGSLSAEDPVERASSRPDVAVLCYPVITLSGASAHMGSRGNLLGNDPPPDLVNSLSSEKQVTARTPPTFLFHTSEDTAVPVENSLLFAMACGRARVPVELHVYEKGMHGVGLAQSDPILRTWTDRLAD